MHMCRAYVYVISDAGSHDYLLRVAAQAWRALHRKFGLDRLESDLDGYLFHNSTSLFRDAGIERIRCIEFNRATGHGCWIEAGF